MYLNYLKNIQNNKDFYYTNNKIFSLNQDLIFMNNYN